MPFESNQLRHNCTQKYLLTVRLYRILITNNSGPAAHSPGALLLAGLRGLHEGREDGEVQDGPQGEQYSTVQYSTVQYSTVLVLRCLEASDLKSLKG